jgi:hypothetical protein
MIIIRAKKHHTIKVLLFVCLLTSLTVAERSRSIKAVQFSTGSASAWLRTTSLCCNNQNNRQLKTQYAPMGNDLVTNFLLSITLVCFSNNSNLGQRYTFLHIKKN